MTIKLIGAILIIVSCAGMGFSMAASQIKAERSLEQLILATEWMTNELQHHMSPLPDLCRQAAIQVHGRLRTILITLADELDRQEHSDAHACMSVALENEKDLPESAAKHLHRLGQSIGRFDLAGQLSGLESVRQSAQRELDGLRANMDTRIRSYRTLGICAGAALAILFI